VRNPADVQTLLGGRFLIAECMGNVVTERDRRDTVLWQLKLTSNPVSCQRPSSGPTTTRRGWCTRTGSTSTTREAILGRGG
jgi:hypothetical protein